MTPLKSKMIARRAASWLALFEPGRTVAEPAALNKEFRLFSAVPYCMLRDGDASAFGPDHIRTPLHDE